MAGRRDERVRKRITADVRIGEKHWKGLVVDLSASGLFVQMDAATLPPRGLDVELELAESRYGPAMRLSAVVVRRELTSAMLGAVSARGVGLRIIEPPPEYHEAVLAMQGGGTPTTGTPERIEAVADAAAGAPVDDGASIEIEIDTGADPGDRAALGDREAAVDHDTEEAAARSVPASPVPAAVELPPTRRGVGGTFQSLLGASGATPAVPEGRDLGSGGLGDLLLGASRGPAAEPAGAPRATTATEAPKSTGAAAGGLEPLVMPEPGPGADAPKPLVMPDRDEASDAPRPLGMPGAEAPFGRADVLCVYEGGVLDDVFEQLRELGARPQRARLTGPTAFSASDPLPRLLVIPASDALRVELPETIPGDTVRIAVADSQSEVLGGLFARLGYDYLVRRPVHPELLRRLLQELLYRGSDVRKHARHAAGWPVQLRQGWQAIRATLIDWSSGGARVLVPSDVALLAEVRLRVPRSSRHPVISLPGRVIRKREIEPGLWSLALRFDGPLETETLALLDRASESGAVGPSEAPSPSLLGRLRAWWQQPHHAPAVGEPEPAGDEAAERRIHPRGRLEREVLDLDPVSQAPRNVLVGRDLSLGGLRVDPHPGLERGDVVTLALFDAAGAPFQAQGRVARDDGERGLVVVFDAPDEATRRCIEELVGSLPAIERLGEAAQSVVFAQIVPERVPAPSLDEAST